MKRLKLFKIVIVILLLTAAFISDEKIYPPKRVHVFIDYATTPTLLQMIELIKLPADDIKIVSWRRFKNRLPLLKEVQSNVYEWNLNSVPEENKDFIVGELKKIMSKYRHVDWFLHFNYKHIGWNDGFILSSLPVHHIKELHLYEDGMGTFVRDDRKKRMMLFRSFSELFQLRMKVLKKELRKGNGLSYGPMYEYLLPYLYPTYIHIAFPNLLKDKNLLPATFVPVDFMQLKKTLTHSEKKKLFHVLDFHPFLYSKQLHGLEMGIYLYDGFKVQKRRKAASLLQQKLLKQKNVVWFSKRHPRTAVLKEPNGFLPILENYVPFEAFLLSDLPLTYVAGEGSSSFYSVSPEMIVGYIPNLYRHYVKHLLDLKILTPDKIYDWKLQKVKKSVKESTQ